MIKKSSAVLAVCLSFCILFSLTVLAESERDPNLMVSLLQSAMKDTWDDYDIDLSAYGDNCIRMKIGMKGIGAKDFTVCNRSQVIEAWNNAKSSWADMSKAAYDVFTTLGFDDKLFTVCVMDDISDESSDVWFVAVNGNIVYDLFC